MIQNQAGADAAVVKVDILSRVWYFKTWGEEKV